ncbi:MAG TPA: CsgG/HfaB family protein [Gemmatimonadales bacterium]|nr:CsgG/HfaB family protein [Gemmatimonadales bacterium]
MAVLHESVGRLHVGALALVVTGAALSAAGCAGRGPTQVSPEELPALESRLNSDPDNHRLRSRYAAALFAADRCDAAIPEAQRALAMAPGEALPVLIMGQCQEKQGQLDEALGTYRTFLSRYGTLRGASAVRARELLAFRERANQRARLAIQNEAQLSQQPTDPNTIAVLPLEVTGDTAYRALSRGLAQILTSDLALIQRFRLVERLQLSALMDELNLAQGGRVDPGTAARVGRMIQAGRLVQGAAVIPPEGAARLEASVVLPTGEVTDPTAVTGRFRDLLRIEKDLVIGLSARLGYTLSEAERRMILENGTQNLTAFLAYSRGLVAEDAGDFSRAAAYFSQAVQADPGFQQARESFQAAATADAVREASAGEVTTVLAQEPTPEPPAEVAVNNALNSTVTEVAPTQVEKTAPTQQQQSTPANNTPAFTPPSTPTSLGTPPSATGTIRIVFRLP